MPIELGILVRAGRGSDARIRSVVPYRRPLPLRDWLWLLPALVIVAFIGFGVSMAFEPAVIDSAFGWLPDWFVRPIDIDRIAAYSRDAWLVTLAAFLVLNGFVGPIVEELYFRGYLLPRMDLDGSLGAARQRDPLLALPLLVALADRRADPSASGLRCTRCAGRRTCTSGWSCTAP